MKLGLAMIAVVLAGCVVRMEDTQAWVGRPVSELELHPVFLSMRLVRTVASDGTEVRNYINGANVSSCSGNGSIFGGPVSSANYSQFSSCMSSFAACNNIFYVKNGVVQSYVPTGSGGARCYTDDTLKPRFRGASNL